MPGMFIDVQVDAAVAKDPATANVRKELAAHLPKVNAEDAPRQKKKE